MIPSNSNTERPQAKELLKKIREAVDSIRNNTWRPANVGKLQADFDRVELECGIETALRADQSTLFLRALGEITPQDYAGLRPPEPSYEPTVKDVDMFAFSWKSEFFGGREMYFKFCIKGRDEGKKAYIFSIHPSDK